MKPFLQALALVKAFPEQVRTMVPGDSRSQRMTTVIRNYASFDLMKFFQTLMFACSAVKSKRKMAAFYKTVVTNNTSASFQPHQEIIAETAMSKATSASILQGGRRTTEASVGENTPSAQSKGTSYDTPHNPTEVNGCTLRGRNTKEKPDTDSGPLLRG